MIERAGADLARSRAACCSRRSSSPRSPPRPAPETEAASAAPPRAEPPLAAARPEAGASTARWWRRSSHGRFSAPRDGRRRAATARRKTPAFTDTRLAGIVTEPGHRFAIFAPTGAKPMIVTEGDTVSGWRVDSITPREVSLSGPGGTKTLQPKIDPNLAPPAPPPMAAATPPPLHRSTRRQSGRRCGQGFRRRCLTGRRCDRVSFGSGDGGAGRCSLATWRWRWRWSSSARASSRSSGLTPLEQPSALQPAAPRISGPIPTNRSQERPFEDRRAPSVAGAAGSSPPPPPGVAAGESGDVTLNFVDTDIREIVRAVLGTTLKVDYTIDPAVHGTGSIETPAPLPRSALLRGARSAAQPERRDHGAKGTASTTSCRSRPQRRAISRPARARSGPAPRSCRCATPPPRTSPKCSSPMSARAARSSPTRRGNALLVTGDAAVRQTLVGLIRAFDIDILSGRSYALYPGRRRRPGQARRRARKSAAGAERRPARRHRAGAADGAGQRGSGGLRPAALPRRRRPLFSPGPAGRGRDRADLARLLRAERAEHRSRRSAPARLYPGECFADPAAARQHRARRRPAELWVSAMPRAATPGIGGAAGGISSTGTGATGTTGDRDGGGGLGSGLPAGDAASCGGDAGDRAAVGRDRRRRGAATT